MLEIKSNNEIQLTRWDTARLSVSIQNEETIPTTKSCSSLPRTVLGRSLLHFCFLQSGGVSIGF